MTGRPSPQRPTERIIGMGEFVILCACLMAMNALSIDPMLPALPDIARDLHLAHANDRQMVISAYLLGAALGTVPFGTLADRFGRRPVFAAALALFLIATIACAAAQSFAMLLAGRACAGFFAASSRVITVSIIRDRFDGDAMARIMSLIFGVFMIVPVLAPSMGQAVLAVAHWRWIFWVLAITGAAVLLWLQLRMPETLAPDNRVPISLAGIGRTVIRILSTRDAIGYMLAAGIVMSGLFGFVISVQQILFDMFDAEQHFGLYFALVAGCMGLGSLINSRLVSRLGARRLSQGALIALIALSLIHIAVILAGSETLVTFLCLQAATMLAIAFTGSNFNAISMEPFARGAGTASSFQAFLTGSMSAVLGGLIGNAFDGTTLPLALGLLCAGLAALAVIYWAERGRLFTRPRRDQLRRPDINPLR